MIVQKYNVIMKMMKKVHTTTLASPLFDIGNRLLRIVHRDCSPNVWKGEGRQL